MKRIVRRAITGGILGGQFGLLTTATWPPLLGAEGPGLQMALPMTAGFALLGAWFASIPCLADTKTLQGEPALRAKTTHDRLAA